MSQNTKVIVAQAPPEYYPGRAVTAVLQGPTEQAVSKMIGAIDQRLVSEGLEPTEVIQIGPDPNGGYRAIIVSHNANPVTWFSEQVERARLGFRGAAEQGQRKAAIKHEIARKGELARAAAAEVAHQRVKLAEITGPQKEREKTAAIRGIAKERARQIQAAESVASEAELARIRRELAAQTDVEAAEHAEARRREYRHRIIEETPVGVYEMPPGILK